MGFVLGLVLLVFLDIFKWVLNLWSKVHTSRSLFLLIQECSSSVESGDSSVEHQMSLILCVVVDSTLEVVDSTSYWSILRWRLWWKSYRRFEDKFDAFDNLFVIFVIFLSSVVDWLVAFHPWFFITIEGASIVVFPRKNH